MTDKVQKIREKIEMVVNRRLNLLNGDYFDLNNETNGFTNEIMDIIDSLQKEPVSKEIGNYDHKAVMEPLCPQLKEEPTIPDIVDEHFHEMLGEEPVSDDLEKAANDWNEKASFNPFYMVMNGDKPIDVKRDITTHADSFKAGAKWQKDQLMAKAFDGEILENYDGKVIKYDDTILDEKLSDCKVFDKVKIIVIKED